MIPSNQNLPALTVREVIESIERILDRYWREELADSVTTEWDPKHPHVFYHLQLLDRLRLELMRRQRRKRP